MRARLPEFDGVVLAGGRSRRMGRAKATLRLGGVELWRRQAAVLRKAGAGRVWLSLRPRQRTPGGATGVLRDPAESVGPLGGIVAGLRASGAPHLAVIAVDMPDVDPAWVRALVRACRRGKGAVVRSRGGYEPLAAVYPREARPVAERALGKRRLKLQLLVARLRRGGLLRTVRAPARSLTNWNSPGDAGVVIGRTAGLRRRSP